MPHSDPRLLRRNSTQAEQRLWAMLRNSQIAGFKFRRQQPIGPYVADFCCWRARLVIEVDGGQHADSAHDETRTHWLSERGWRVIRFWNNEVLNNTDGVLQVVVAALNPPSP